MTISILQKHDAICLWAGLGNFIDSEKPSKLYIKYLITIGMI